MAGLRFLQRVGFLMIKEETANAETGPSIVVVQNWHEELKRLVSPR